MSVVDGAKTITNNGAKTIANICAAFIRRARAMDGFAAGGASGCAASATLCLIISFSGASDASGWAALVWAAATIGTLGAYMLVRGLSAQAMSYDDPKRASHAGDLSPMTDSEVVSRAIAVAAVATLVLVVVLFGPFG